MYRRILVAIDGSPTANQGLKEAIRLATDQGARLLLVHVVDEFIPLTGFEPLAYTDEYTDALKQVGRKVIERAQDIVRKRGITAQSVLLESVAGPAADLIVRQAKRWHADLIVLGTHGRRGLRRLVLGSDAEQVVRASPVPVLLVRATLAPRRRGSRARKKR